MTLYEIHDSIHELMAELDNVDPTDDDNRIDEIEETLGHLYDKLDKKREAYVHVSRSADAHAKALRAESRRLAGRAKAMEYLSERMKLAVKEDMMKTGEARADAGIFKLRSAKSPPKVELLVPAEMLPTGLQKIAITANTNAIRQALRNGQHGEGVELKQGTHLRVS